MKNSASFNRQARLTRGSLFASTLFAALLIRAHAQPAYLLKDFNPQPYPTSAARYPQFPILFHGDLYF